MKKLVLSYELAWRTEEDKKFLKRKEWLKEIRPRILKLQDYTCQYCGYRKEEKQHINHIDGNPKNNKDENLEVICNYCHMITHAGLWCVVLKSVDIYEKSKYNQNEIVQITRKMREEEKTDDEIIKFLGLENKTNFKQDLKYLAERFGFITSRKKDKGPPRITLTEKEQKEALQNRSNW